MNSRQMRALLFADKMMSDYQENSENQPQQQRPQGPPPGAPHAQNPQGRPPHPQQAGPPPGYGQRPGGPPPQGRPPYAGPPPQWGGYAPQPAGGAMRPPWQAPQPQKMRRSPIPLIIGLVVLVFFGGIFLFTLIGGMTAGSGGGGGSFLLFGDKIAILEINGVLGEGPAYGADTERLRELVERWTKDSSIKGMIIRINSPGGAVSATQDLFQAIEEFKTGGDDGKPRPVVASMGDIAASGGYYIAMAADEVYANPGTLTGSVGVILNFWGYEGLSDKIGIEARNVKSGKFKDIGSGARPMTEEEKELLNEMIDSVFNQFFEVVLEGRGDEVRAYLAEQSGQKPSAITDAEIEEYLRAYTDGRIFSGQQAYDWALIDQLGTLGDVEDKMKKQLGLDKEARVVETPDPQPGLFGMINQKAAAIQQMAPGTVTMEYRFEM